MLLDFIKAIPNLLGVVDSDDYKLSIAVGLAFAILFGMALGSHFWILLFSNTLAVLISRLYSYWNRD